MAGIFVIHLQNEPATLDPHSLRSSNFITQNLYRNLYRYDDKTNLVPDLADACTHAKLNITCTLKKNLKWSDGTDILPQHIINSYERFTAKETKSPRADILANVKFKASENKIIFNLEKPDPLFLHRLASPFTVPIKLDDNKNPLGTGPFKLTTWKPTQNIILTRNKNDYVTQSFSTDIQKNLVNDIEFKIVDESVLALRMFEAGKVQYLPLMPTVFIPAWQTKPEFARVYLARFDYLAFGPQLADQPEIRRALAGGIDYKGFQKIIHAEGLPGCSGLPDEWAPNLPCIETEPKRSLKDPGFLEYQYSLYAVEDLKRSAEWFQQNWKQNLGWNVRLKGMEARVLLDNLKKNPPTLFRRALTPEFPVCVSAMEVFSSNHPDNYIRLKSAKIDSLVTQLKNLDPASNDAKKLCFEGLSYLINERYLVPLGPMSFATLLDKNFTGLQMNALYQMDLTRLQRSSRSAK